MTAIAASIDEIARAPERNSVRVGLERLEIWRTGYAGSILDYGSVTYESPSRLFKVAFAPDFGIQSDDSGVAVHIWNTVQPRLLPEMTYGAISLFRPLYEETDNAPDDLAVLSLREPELYRLSEAGGYADMGADLVARIESTVREVSDELDLPPDGEEHAPEPRP